MGQRFAGACLGAALAWCGTWEGLTAPATETPRSGFEDMSAESRAMQADDNANPGMLWVADGEGLWSAAPRPGARSCAECHGKAAMSMKGVSARLPAIDEASGRPVDLQGRIMICRTERQGAPAARENHDILALSAYVGFQSRGMAMTPPDDPRLAPFREAGRELFTRRQGQLDLACADCHDANAGRTLGGNTIPQGHPNGYPLYRLEWQSLGSLQRRLRGCMTGIRAEAPPYGAPELIALELFLASRAAGLLVETPAVRP